MAAPPDDHPRVFPAALITCIQGVDKIAGGSPNLPVAALNRGASTDWSMRMRAHSRILALSCGAQEAHSQQTPSADEKTICGGNMLVVSQVHKALRGARGKAEAVIRDRLTLIGYATIQRTFPKLYCLLNCVSSNIPLQMNRLVVFPRVPQPWLYGSPTKASHT